MKAWLDAESITVLDWPAQSPDLNPIENFWSILKSRAISYDTIHSVKYLERAVEKAWSNASLVQLCSDLVASMPQRIAACIAAKGGHTKY